jgi:hypothetical protein
VPHVLALSCKAPKPGCKMHHDCRRKLDIGIIAHHTKLPAQRACGTTTRRNHYCTHTTPKPDYNQATTDQQTHTHVSNNNRTPKTPAQQHVGRPSNEAHLLAPLPNWRAMHVARPVRCKRCAECFQFHTHSAGSDASPGWHGRS